jgi:hypothetical protein
MALKSPRFTVNVFVVYENTSLPALGIAKPPRNDQLPDGR